MDRSIIDDGLFRKIVFVSVILVLASAGSAGAVTNITSCGTISSSGVYELIQNITNSSTCIRITSSDVVFDGRGNIIDGTKANGTYGIYVYNGNTTLTNVTVKNTIVTEWNNSILYENVENGTITGNTVSYNKEDGIGLYSSSDNSITGNNAFKNDYGGIYLGNSTGNTITNNNASYNKLEGIFLEVSSNYNTITNNTITGNSISINSYGGIALLESTDNTIKDNTVSDDGENGIALYSSSNSNTITGNNASSNSYGGIYLYNSGSNNITGNTLSNNKEDGIALYSSSNNNTITGNNAFSNNYGGIYIESSSNNNITGNTLSNNALEGVALYLSSNNNITGNTLSNNSYLGIGLYPSSSDNTIKDNTVTGNTLWGIYLESASNNTIYNNFFNNTNNTYDNGNNSWNTTKTAGTNIVGGPYIGGNYYSDYNGNDTDGDGIGDTGTYNILNGSNIDSLPLIIPIQVSTCTVISKQGLYVLNQNIIDSGNSTCIEITVSNVIFNGVGHTIDGTDNASTYGIYVYNNTSILANIMVMNTIVTGWGYGIYYNDTQNGSITNITANNNSIGISLNSSSNSNTVSDNILTDYCIGVAIYSSSNRILGNTILDRNSSCGSGTCGSGVYIEGAGGNNNTIAGNTIRRNKYGVYLFNEDSTVVEGNNITDSNYGIYLFDSPNNCSSY